MEKKFKTIIVRLTPNHSSLYDDVNLSSINSKKVKEFINVIKNSYTQLEENGFIYVYGNPSVVSYFVGKYLNDNKELFLRYWIAINTNENYEKENTLARNHMAAIMLLRSDSKSIDLDTESCRTMRFACPACGKNSKDWGGKKHLLNVKGVAISDVWNDFVNVQSSIHDKDLDELILNISDNTNSCNFDETIPEDILNRMLKLTKSQNNYKEVLVDDCMIPIPTKSSSVLIEKAPFTEENTVYCGDSVEKMKELANKYPNGLFDLVFADPPYNLNKDYNNYDDTNSDESYNEWCKEWLLLCFKLLKPSGHMLILNLPKWTVRNIQFLIDNGATVQDCIVWDAMSTPMGKVMPAHYSLIDFTKGNPKETFINSKIYPALNYCLRPACIKQRNSLNSKMIPVSNIWSDLHRIKHKKDRDEHPCQLPDHLMDRIVNMFSLEEDLVFDPFCGAGTTALAAIRNKRNYFTIDISPEYVNIATKKIEELKTQGAVIRHPEIKAKRKVSKKKMELYVQKLMLTLGKKIEDDELVSVLYGDENAGFSKEDIIDTYGSIHQLIKKCSFVVRKNI